jgi:hypothetical protein
VGLRRVPNANSRRGISSHNKVAMQRLPGLIGENRGGQSRNSCQGPGTKKDDLSHFSPETNQPQHCLALTTIRAPSI